jgi:chromosome segregation ATPase
MQREAYDKALASREEAIAVLSQARADADAARAEARATVERARAEVAALVKRREEITAQIRQLSGDLTSIRTPSGLVRASDETELRR